MSLTGLLNQRVTLAERDKRAKRASGTLPNCDDVGVANGVDVATGAGVAGDVFVARGVVVGEMSGVEVGSIVSATGSNSATNRV